MGEAKNQLKRLIWSVRNNVKTKSRTFRRQEMRARVSEKNFPEPRALGENNGVRRRRTEQRGPEAFGTWYYGRALWRSLTDMKTDKDAFGNNIAVNISVYTRGLQGRTIQKAARNVKIVWENRGTSFERKNEKKINKWRGRGLSHSFGCVTGL